MATRLNKLKALTLGLLLGVGGFSVAATFNLFQPASGILVGNPSSYITTAATSANVISLWSGTCNSGTFLRADGSCQAISGSGTVTSVGLTGFTGITVTGSPITDSGTFALSTTLDGLLQGNGSGFTAITNSSTAGQVLRVTGASTYAWGALDLADTDATTGNLPVSRLNGGTSASSSTFWRGDGTWATPAGSGTVTSVGLAGTGIFGASGSPVTTSGTLTLTVTGTSGGVPYFSASGTLSSSAALTAGQVVIGGGAGTAPSVLAAGTEGQVLSMVSGTPTWTSGLGIDDLPASEGLSTGDLFLVYDLSDTESQQATAAQVQSFVLGNAFTAFTGPTTSTKTFTLPNASSTILTTNAAVTVAQGGSGATTLTGILVGNGTSPFTAVTAPSGTIVGTSDTQTLTNKRVNPRVQTAADATSVTPTGDSADMTIQANTQTAGTLTMNAPTGTPVDGQKWTFRITSTNVQTYSWNGIYRGSSDAALPTASTGGGDTDYIGFIYNSASSTWDFVSTVAGF